MNNIESTIWIGFLFIISILCLNYLFLDVTDSAVVLDEESVNMMSKFDTRYEAMRNSSALLNSDIENAGLPNYDGVAAEFREVAEAKGTVGAFDNLWDVFVEFPSAMLAGLPFIEETASTFIVLLIEAIVTVFTIMQIISLYKALRSGQTKD